MKHNLFKPKTLEEAKHSVVGNCNGFTMQERWEKETPEFARAILQYSRNTPGFTILDYGCGVGRLSKEVLKQASAVTVIGLDASPVELERAREYVNDSRFITVLPHELEQKVDLAYCVYVLQHAPAVEIREILARIHNFLKDEGRFVYCSSDYRMAIRFDGGGFFDDRFLGVNLQEEIERMFEYEGELFPSFPNAVVEKMVTGGKDGLPHPAKVYRKRRINSLFSLKTASHSKETSEALVATASATQAATEHLNADSEGPKNLILRNRQSPGDILVMSAAIRALHNAYPGKFKVAVESPCNEIFENSPYVEKLESGQVIDMQYPEIHKSGASGRHFTEGHRKFLEEVLEIPIPRAGLLPDIFLTQDEMLWPSPVEKHYDLDRPYICINGGSKSDFPLKQYHRWQEVVDLWNKVRPEIKLVQIGLPSHNHKPLSGALDMRGKTSDSRELFRTIYKSLGVFTCVSYPMHIAAALRKPCVVVAGAREGTRWELYPDHRFLYMNGAMDCALYDGCWRSKIEECKHPVQPIGQDSNVPLCLDMIRPEDVVRAMELYILGGAIKLEEVSHV